jgi:hypothetical protein
MTTVCVRLSAADMRRLEAIAFVWVTTADEALRRLIRDQATKP